MRISSIYNMANADPPTGEVAESINNRMFKRAWQQHGLLVINPQTINDEWERQHLINVAEAAYGKRGHHEGKKRRGKNQEQEKK